MLTDIFANRYSGLVLWDALTERDPRFLVQAFRIVKEQIYPPNYSDGKPAPKPSAAWKIIHDKLSMELGLIELGPHTSGYWGNWGSQKVWVPISYSDCDVCEGFMLVKFDESISADRFMKERMSLIELAFREKHREIMQLNERLSNEILMTKITQPDQRLGLRLPGNRADGLRAANAGLNGAFKASTDELNARLQQAGYGLHFHNGFIQASADALVQKEIEALFWTLVANAAWANVDTDMKEAIDRRDNGGRDPAWYAGRALESTIKIISGNKGWTHGGERGAHNFIENLGSKKNGEFINEWESQILKQFFSAVRNPFGHGPGEAPMPSLISQQTDWAIEFCMAWIKNLIRRM